MHELGVIVEVVKTVERIVEQNKLEKVDTIILQVGELSSMIPKYIEECFPAAVYGSILEGTKLKIEILPGNALCKLCGKVYNLLANENICPHCSCGEWELLSGKEFMIKEIIAC